MLKWKSRNAGIIYFYFSRWRAKWQRRRIEEIAYEARVEPILMVMRRRLKWFGNDKRRDGTEHIIGLYRENAIAVQNESGDSNGGNV